MGHPIGDINKNPVDARFGNLPDMLHILLSPFMGIGGNPYILVSFPDPEGVAPAKLGWPLCYIPLHPVWVVLKKTVVCLVGILCNTLQPCYIHKGVIIYFMHFCSQLP
jgi:hypothetical protein